MIIREMQMHMWVDRTTTVIKFAGQIEPLKVELRRALNWFEDDLVQILLHKESLLRKMKASNTSNEKTTAKESIDWIDEQESRMRVNLKNLNDERQARFEKWIQNGKK